MLLLLYVVVDTCIYTFIRQWRLKKDSKKKYTAYPDIGPTTFL